MSINISPANEEFLAGQVAAGVYQSRNDALDAAVSLLRQQTDVLAKVDRGRRQLDNGDAIEYDESTLHEMFENLKAGCRPSVSDKSGS